MNRVIVFDLDQTSLDGGERNIFWYAEPKNFKAGLSGIKHDIMIEPVIELMRFYHSLGDKIIIASARTETCRNQNVEWFKNQNLHFDDMYLRKENDSRSDDIIKKEMLEDIKIKWGKPFAVFEDNESVIDMYKNENIFVFEIHQNDRIVKRP